MSTPEITSAADLSSWSIALASAHDEITLIQRLQQAIQALGLARDAQLYWLEGAPTPLFSSTFSPSPPDESALRALAGGAPVFYGPPEDQLALLPLIFRQLVGWLALAAPAQECSALLPLLQQVAASLTSFRRADEADAEVRNLALLNEIGRRLNTTLELESIFLQVEEAIGLLMQNEHFYIALFDHRRGVLRLASFVEHGAHREPGNTWHLQEGLTGSIVRTGQAILTDDYLMACAERDVAPILASGSHAAKAWLGVPLQAERILGAIVVYSYQEGVRFTSRQMRLLSALADQAAATIERARLYDRTAAMARQLAAINEIGRAMTSTLDPEQVPSIIMGFIQEILDVEEGSLLLRDEYTHELIFAYSLSPTGRQLLGTRIPPSVGIASEVVRSGVPILTNDAASHPAFYQQIDDNTGFVTRNLLCVPLRGRQGIQGVIEVMNRRGDEPFTREDQRLLELVADQAAVALENARLYARTDRTLTLRVQELDERNHQLHEILRVANAMLAATTLDELLPQIASAVHSTSGFGRVVISLVRREPGRRPVLRHVAVAGVAPEVFARLEQLPSSPDRVEALLQPQYQRGSSTYFIDHRAGLYQQLWGEEDLFTSSEVGEIEPGRWHPRDMLLTVLRSSGGELMGILTVGQHANGLLPEPEQIQTLEIFASQASVGLENAGLYEQQRVSLQGLTALSALGLAMNSTLNTPDEILRFSVAGIFDATGAIGAGVLLRENIDLLPLLQIGRAPELGPELTELAMLVVDSGKPRMYQAPRHHLPQCVIDAGGQALILYPLRGPHATMGAIYAIYPELLPGEREQELISLFTGQAGVALESLRLSDAVRQGRDRLASILASTEEGIVMVDEQGEVVESNPAFNRLFPLDPLALHAISAEGLIATCEATHGGEHDGWADLLAGLNLVRAKKLDESHGRLLITGVRPRAFAWSVLPISGSEGTTRATILVMRDISGEVEAERMRQDLTSMIIHDLRGPLSSMLTAMDMLDRGTAGSINDPQRNLVGMASRSSRKLLKLIDTLLDINKLEEGRLQLELGEHQLPPIVESVAQQYAPLMQDRQIALRNEIAPDLPPALADANHVERILQNLLDNAIKHTRRSMTVSMACRLATADQLPAGHPEGRWLRLSVADAGPGIPADQRERVFEKFAQVSQSRVKGTGLGLTFCRLSVEAHGGRIWVEANEPTGSVFHFTLPVAGA